MVRAKFIIDKLERVHTTVPTGERDAQGRAVYGPGVLITVSGRPVYGNGDPAHENSKFWHATPSGSVTLGSVNERLAEFFELGKEYFVDFTKAE